MAVPVYLLRISAIGGIALMSFFIIHSYNMTETTSQRLHNRFKSIHPYSRTLLDSPPQVNETLPDLVSLSLDDFTNSEANLNKQEKAAVQRYWAPENQLIPGLVPGIIHFVWCGKRWFEFKHYLSVQSVVRSIKPDKIVIHVQDEPLVDHLYYHQWFDNIKHDFPFLLVETLKPEQMAVCESKNRDAKIGVILDFLKEEGGMYVGDSTWIINFPAKYRLVDFDFSLEPEGMDGYIILRDGILKNHTYEDLLADSTLRKQHSTCATVRQFYNVHHTVRCVVVKGGRYEHFTPMHIWESNEIFVRLCRRIFYGTERVLKPQPSYDELVPNIGHMIWLGGGQMDFLFYLSALSMLYVLKVDNLYIHGDKPPTGPYWEKLKQQTRVKLIYRPQPQVIYEGKIDWYFRALMSDLIRVDIMVKYGGIYGDTDAIWVQPLSHEERGYDAVASFDWVDWSYPFPDSVNFGLSYGKRNAPFWRIFRDSMRTLHNDIHGFTGVMMPYKLLEKYPHLLKIDSHLQVICYQFRCHPTYVNDYHNMAKDHITSNSIPNWKKDVHAFHWTHPNPPEYANETTLLASTGLFADIGKFVLKEAGLL